MIVTTRISAGGRIVLPVEFRRSLGAKIGDEVVLQLEDQEVRLFTRRHAIARAQAMVRQYVPESRSLVDELIAERRAAAARE